MDHIRRRDTRIPIASPSLNGIDRASLLDAFDSGWISSKGPYVTKFERKFAEYVGVPHSLATTSGTAALHLALVAAGITTDDEVILPDLTFAAVAHAVMYCGAKPIFCDVDQDTWVMSAKHIKPKITSKTRAIIAVHLYGNVCPMKQIMRLAKRFGLLVIEDCAESLGSCVGREQTGSFGDFSTFSFYANKVITTGEGGMVCTNHLEFFNRLKALRNHCMERDYYHSGLGFNYRMTNLQAALGLSQLIRIKSFIEKKKQIKKWYNSSIGNKLLEKQVCTRESTPWMYNVLVNSDRARFVRHMNSHNIETRVVFPPMSTLPHLLAETQPNSRWIARRGVSLPTGVNLEEQDVDYICKVAQSFRS